MKTKKGDISVTTMIVVAIGLVVLVIVIGIFYKQMKTSAGGYSTIGDDATASARGIKCETFLGSRQCADEADLNKNYEWEEVQPPTWKEDGVEVTKWKDCTKTCFERIGKKDKPKDDTTE